MGLGCCRSISRFNQECEECPIKSVTVLLRQLRTHYAGKSSIVDVLSDETWMIDPAWHYVGFIPSIPTTTCRATFAVRCLQSFRIQAAEPMHVTISSLCPKLFGAERRAVMTWKISVSSVGHCNQTQLSHIFRLDGDATQAPLPDTAVKV